MSTHVERLSKALQEAHPSMFGGAPRAESLDEALGLYRQVAERLVELGARLHQGDQEALREGPGQVNAAVAELAGNVVTVERVSNGYVIRHLASTRSAVAGDDGEGPIRVAADMLGWVNEFIGEVGGRNGPERLRVIVLPGDDWIPAEPGDCRHAWVERNDRGDSWFCPCGAQFQLEHKGRSFADSAST